MTDIQNADELAVHIRAGTPKTAWLPNHPGELPPTNTLIPVTSQSLYKALQAALDHELQVLQTTDPGIATANPLRLHHTSPSYLRLRHALEQAHNQERFR